MRHQKIRKKRGDGKFPALAKRPHVIISLRLLRRIGSYVDVCLCGNSVDGVRFVTGQSSETRRSEFRTFRARVLFAFCLARK